MCAFVIVITDCAKYQVVSNEENGSQYITIGGKIYLIYFAGWKCYFHINESTVQDFLKYDTVELMSQLIIRAAEKVTF